jgi:predicted N-acetyltransferase YhbS
MALSLRPYQTSDFESLKDLWQITLGSNWPLTPEYLARMTTESAVYHEGDHIVAEQDGQIVGFVATRVHASGKGGGLPLLIVHPSVQRRGIGTQLHRTALEYLRQRQVETINFTAGGEPFWPGVPWNSPGAQEFFKASGWNFTYNSYDLTRDLTNYQTPPGVLERAAQQGILYRVATADEAPLIIAFEDLNFPFWTEYFAETAAEGRYMDILAAWDGDEVVGSLLLSKIDLKTRHQDGLWHLMLGDNMGTIGAVGVTEARQGHGIGLAMVATASEILQERGVRQCVIGWTDLMNFYGKLGYTIWREYWMAEPRAGSSDFGT